MSVNTCCRRAVALLLLAAAASGVRAQLIEDVDLRREGADAVLQIRFVSPVQFRRAVAASQDLVQAYYDVLPAGDELHLITSERRLAAANGLPGIRITDESVNRANLSRRLVIRFSAPTASRVRAGRGNRSIDLVLPGRAPQVPVAAPAAPEPGSGERYVISLQRSTDPYAQLDAPVPSALQRYQVFTAQRVVDGQTLHEVNIGHFETLAEAEAARATLLARFPQASIVDLQPAPAAAAPVAAARTAEAAAPPRPPVAAPAEIEAQAASLLAGAKASAAKEDFAAALDQLNQLLNLPPNASSREAQELVGMVRLKVGDVVQARAEFELFLKLHPSGPDAERVRRELERLPAPVAAAPRQRPAAAPSTTLSGSASLFFYGGQSKVRTQEFQDSPLSGLPELVSDSPFSAVDQKQLVANVDLNWRHRDADNDLRFVFRDSHTEDLLPEGRNRDRLSALYVDHRSTRLGTQIRLGRQSAGGGGVLGRFDGVQAGYAVVPKWRLNVVAGVPNDKLLDSRRHFAGSWIEAEALTPQISGSLYVIQQSIDGEIDRRSIGTELRYFNGGVSLSGVLDHDRVMRRMNIASLQGTWQLPDTTTVNFLYDRRATPMLMLGNALFFQDPNLPMVTRLRDLLGTTTLEALREQVRATTSTTTQALLGATAPLTPRWQLGADMRLTNVGAIPPVAVILPMGQPGTGNLWSLGSQLIGTNLYSSRDTHVASVTVLSGPLYKGVLLSYNNSTQWAEVWQFEPSLKLYTQNDDTGARVTRWTPGVRVSYRLGKQVAVESELSSEFSKSTTPATATTLQRNESSHRVFYYLGGRYDF